MNEQTSHDFINSDQQTTYIPTSEERTLAILSHILALAAHIIAPLIIYLIKKDESKYVAEHAKESLNFQLTMLICYVISFVLWLIIIGIFITIALAILSLVLVIVASVKASDNKLYRYPINFRIIK